MKALPIVALCLLALSAFVMALLPALAVPARAQAGLPNSVEGDWTSWSLVVNETISLSETMPPAQFTGCDVSGTGTNPVQTVTDITVTPQGLTFFKVQANVADGGGVADFFVNGSGTITRCFSNDYGAQGNPFAIPSLNETLASSGYGAYIVEGNSAGGTRFAEVFKDGVSVQNVTRGDNDWWNPDQVSFGMDASGRYIAMVGADGCPGTIVGTLDSCDPWNLHFLLYQGTGTEAQPPYSPSNPQPVAGTPPSCSIVTSLGYVCQSTTTTGRTVTNGTCADCTTTGLSSTPPIVYPLAIVGIAGCLVAGVALRKRTEGRSVRAITGRGRETWFDRHVRRAFD